MMRHHPTVAVISRRMFLGGAACGIAAASPALAAAPAILKKAGDFRGLSLVNSHTAERLNCVYWIEGEYVPEALEAFNYILRDWREDLVKPIDPQTIDIMAATHDLLDCSEPFSVVSGYRSPKTNAMLRGNSRGGRQELVPHQGHGGGHRVQLAFGRTGCVGGEVAGGRWRRTLQPVELHPYGQRPGPPMGPLTPL